MGHAGTRLARLILAIAAAISSGISACAAEAADVAARMHRGMNVLDDDPFWRDPAAARLQPRHFAALRAADFDTVRINLHLMEHADASGVPDARQISALDKLVEAGLAAGETIILDNHDDQICSRDAEDCRARLRRLWGFLAPHYAQSPERLLFEILNEPHGAITAPVWNAMLLDILAVIRNSNPERNVVIGPAGWNSIDQLGTLDLPENDRHIVVTVHYYAPMTFTHQGASWVESTRNLSGIHWGSDEEMAKLVHDFDGVEAWGEAHHRPIFLGEFGSYDKAGMDSRVRYTSAVARVAEAHGFAWAYWQFDSDFIAYDIDRGEWVRPILDALVPSN